MSTSRDSIKVISRFRPKNAFENSSDSEEIVNFISDDTVELTTKDFTGSFTFDRIFSPSTAQSTIFDYSIRSSVDDILEGYNGTVFAYGQTGSGKSYTMMGPDIDNPETCGIIPRIVKHLFSSILASPQNIEYTVRVSYMEIYMEKIKDLLCPINDNLPIHEEKARGVYVKGLTEVYVASVEEVFEVMREGAAARAVASTNMNQESSRSHSIFVIVVSQKNIETGSSKSGRLYLVDLAGSEKVRKTGASGQTLEEAKKINKSLSALGIVINALTDGKSTHIPYRDSKLTRILQESLGGNSRTSLIINCSPSLYNSNETLSTLRFGVRAKSIQNKAKVNLEYSPAELKAMLRRFQEKNNTLVLHISQLNSELSEWRVGHPVEKSKQVTLVEFDNSKPKKSNPLPSSSSLTSTPTNNSAIKRNTIMLKHNAQTPSRTPTSLHTRSTSTPTNTPVPASFSTGQSGLTIGIPSTNSNSFVNSLRVSDSVTNTPDSRPSSSLDTIVSPDDYDFNGSVSTTLDKDEREEFLKHENELQDQISEKEQLLENNERLVAILRNELMKYNSDFDISDPSVLNSYNLAISQTQPLLMSSVSSSPTAQPNSTSEVSFTQIELLQKELQETKRQMETMFYESHEANSTIESLRTANAELSAELEKANVQLLESSVTQRRAGVEDKDRRKSERMSQLFHDIKYSASSLPEKYKVFDSIINTLEEKGTNISEDDVVYLIEQLAEAKKLIKDSKVALDEQTVEYDGIIKDCSDLQNYIFSLEDKFLETLQLQASLTDTPASSEIKEYLDQIRALKSKAEGKIISSLQEDIEVKSKQISDLNSQIQFLQLKLSQSPAESFVRSLSNDFSKDSSVSSDDSSEGSTVGFRENGGISEGMYNRYISEFEKMKKSLMRELQNRCERVVELEISLDETREQYKTIMKSARSKQQQKKMQFLERNLEHLTQVQRQLIEQNTSLKKDIAIAERKLLSRNERIESLENLVNNSQDRLSNEMLNFELKLKLMRDRLEEARSLQLEAASALEANTSTSDRNIHRRIAKPLRGGGGIGTNGNVINASRPTVVNGNANSENELSVQTKAKPEEQTSRRLSWFSRG